MISFVKNHLFFVFSSFLWKFSLEDNSSSLIQKAYIFKLTEFYGWWDDFKPNSVSYTVNCNVDKQNSLIYQYKPSDVLK